MEKQSMEYEIEKARPEDLPAILVIYAGARAFMAKTGNPNQWKNTHPPRQLLEQDIRKGNLYVLSGEGLHVEQAYATAVVLLATVLCINGLSSLVAGKLTKGK